MKASARLLLGGGVAAVLLWAGAASAQVDPGVSAKIASLGDLISQRDAAVYDRLNIAGRFGVSFKPHEAVCADSGAGTAHCNARVISDFASVAASRRGGASPGAVPPPPSSAYGPAQFLTAYALSGAAASGNPIIAVVDAYDDPNIASDLSAYSTAYAIPQLPACAGAIASSATACFQKVNQSGSTTSHPSSNTGWGLEISLDVEVAHAVCQNCSILLVEANSNGYSDLMAAEDRAFGLGAAAVSNSWGSGEFTGESSYDSHFNHPGVAVTASAGDGGYGVEYPAASPYVTAVGGTSLFLNADNSYNNEIAWSGTGSGCSAYESKPGWQSDAGCARRTVADVSADADPNTGAAVYDTLGYGGTKGWFQVGGTSLAAPLIAAVYAQASVTANTQENALPYADAADLHDVAGGSNGSCGGSYLCTALAGFDGPTGLGTPLGLGAFGGTGGGPPPPPPPPPAQSFTLSAGPTSLSITRGRSGSDTITVIPAGGFSGPVTLSVSGVPSGVSASFSKNPATNSSSLRLSVNRRAGTGTYALIIKGTSGTLSAATTLFLTIN